MNSLDCQLKSLSKAALNLNIFDRLGLIEKRLWRAFYRRTKKIGIKGKDKTVMKEDHNSVRADQQLKNNQNHKLKEGDMVLILPFEEIKKTFDKHYETKGLVFMTAMKQYCGTTRKVIKKVNYIFDEHEWKMRKIKNVVLLDGVICKGEDMYSKEGCDRFCFYFWKETWLKKI